MDWDEVTELLLDRSQERAQFPGTAALAMHQIPIHCARSEKTRRMGGAPLLLQQRMAPGPRMRDLSLRRPSSRAGNSPTAIMGDQSAARRGLLTSSGSRWMP